MTRLLRRISNKELWSELADSPYWEKSDCPPQLLEQVFDSRGISTYLVDSDDDIKRVVAAVSLGWGTFKDFAFVLLNENDVKQLKLTIEKSQSDLFDKEINNRHRDLKNASGLSLIRLVKLIQEKGEFRVVARSEIIELINGYLANDTFQRNAIFPDKKDIERNGKILGDLWRKGYLNLQQPRP